MYVEEYRRLVEKRILDLVANHPTVQAIQRGKSVTGRTIARARTHFTQELGEGDLEVSPRKYSQSLRRTESG